MRTNWVRPPLLALTLAAIAAQPALAQFQAGEPAQSRNDPADTILDGGNVYTPDGWAESIAIRDGVIVAVGDSASVDAFRIGSTEVIDLAGRTVFPGFHDVHVHPLIAGMQEFSCRLPPGATPDIISESVGECASRAEPGEWINGGNWVAAVFEPGQQTRQFLDAVSPDNPVFLYDESHHSVWVNTMALEVAGIDRDTPDPEGGIIEPAAANDAAHIAIAAVNQVDYLVTWNFRHIANATMRARIEDACRRAGRRPPVYLLAQPDHGAMTCATATTRALSPATR